MKHFKVLRCGTIVFSGNQEEFDFFALVEGDVIEETHTETFTFASEEAAYAEGCHQITEREVRTTRVHSTKYEVFFLSNGHTFADGFTSIEQAEQECYNSNFELGVRPM